MTKLNVLCSLLVILGGCAGLSSDETEGPGGKTDDPGSGSCKRKLAPIADADVETYGTVIGIFLLASME